MFALQTVYMAGENVDDFWVAYPWEAGEYGHTIREHERMAEECSENAIKEGK